MLQASEFARVSAFKIDQAGGFDEIREFVGGDRFPRMGGLIGMQMSKPRATAARFEASGDCLFSTFRSGLIGRLTADDERRNSREALRVDSH